MATSVTEPTLFLESLTCHQMTSNEIGWGANDDIILRVNGKVILSGKAGEMYKGETVDLSRNGVFPLKRNVKIEIVEDDVLCDEPLGSHLVGANSKAGPVLLHFNQHGARYSLRGRVEVPPAPAPETKEAWVRFISLQVKHLDIEHAVAAQAPVQPSAPTAPTGSQGGPMGGPAGLRGRFGSAQAPQGQPTASSPVGGIFKQPANQVRQPTDTLALYFDTARQPMINNLIVEEGKNYDLQGYPKQRFLREAMVRMVECDPHSQARNDELGSFKIYSSYRGKGAQHMTFRGPDGGEYGLTYEVV